MQHTVQVHVRDGCRCYDESLPVDNPDFSIPACREIENFPPQCSENPSDVGPCVDALMAWYIIIIIIIIIYQNDVRTQRRQKNGYMYKNVATNAGDDMLIRLLCAHEMTKHVCKISHLNSKRLLRKLQKC